MIQEKIINKDSLHFIFIVERIHLFVIQKKSVKSIHHHCCTLMDENTSMLCTYTNTQKNCSSIFFSCGVVTVARCHGAHVQEGRWVVVDVVTVGLRCLK